jgi:protein-disulfide isomerase
MKKNKNKEGKKEKSKKEEVKKINFRSSKTKKEKSDGLTLSDMKKEQAKELKIKNLTSLLIVLSGLFLGSLFVDVMSFVSKSGYSERALREAEVFELGDKTWVAYQEPAVKVEILIDKNREECPTCNADDILAWLKKFIPTMVVEEIDYHSEQGKKAIDEYRLKTIPALIFDQNIQKSNFFNEDQVEEIFERKENKFILSSSALGLPIGKYLETPGDLEGDMLIGKPEAEIKLVTFFDFQCPYSKIFYQTVKEARAEFSADQLSLVFKNFPLSLSNQSFNASLVAQCAYQQGKFEPMADVLFDKQEEWATAEDIKFFDRYVYQVNLDKKKFDECVNSKDIQNLVRDSVLQGEEYGINVTPASFIDDDFLDGVLQKKDIVKAVRERLGKK